MSNHATHPIEYLPPTRAVWSRFVRQLHTRYPDLLEVNMLPDLTQFLDTCAQIQAKAMSTQGETHEQKP